MVCATAPAPQTQLLTLLFQVQGEYYGDTAARLGYFPSSIVREDQTLKPGKVEVKTDVSVLVYFGGRGDGGDQEGDPVGCDDGKSGPSLSAPVSLALCVLGIIA